MTIAAGSAALAADPLVALTAAGAFRDHAHAGVAGDGGSITTVPANVIAYFNGAVASIPSGWTEVTAARGRCLIAVPSGGTVGGSVGSGLTDLQDPTHTHTGPSHNHQMGLYITNPFSLAAGGVYGASGTFTRTHYWNATGTVSSEVDNALTSSAGTGATGATS